MCLVIIAILQGRAASFRSFVDTLADRFDLNALSASAYSQARKKLNPRILAVLSQKIIEYFDSQHFRRTWKGHRLLAIDGSGSQLPNHPSVAERFSLGSSGRPDGRLSMLYDPLNHLIEEIFLESMKVSEHDLFMNHIKKVQYNDIVLLDSGYASKALMSSLYRSGAYFVVRLRTHWKVADDLMHSPNKERFIYFDVPNNAKRLIPGAPSFPVRLVKITAPSGEKIILATNLLDNKKYKISDIKFLYKTRWQIEEAYKRLKARMEMNNWTGKRIECVLQDVQASAVIYNLSSVLIAHAQASKHENNSRKTEPNRIYVIAKARETLWLLIKGSIAKKIVEKLLNRILKNFGISPPSKSKYRRKTKRKPYTINYVRA